VDACDALAENSKLASQLGRWLRSEKLTSDLISRMTVFGW